MTFILGSIQKMFYFFPSNNCGAAKKIIFWYIEIQNIYGTFYLHTLDTNPLGTLQHLTDTQNTFWITQNYFELLMYPPILQPKKKKKTICLKVARTWQHFSSILVLLQKMVPSKSLSQRFEEHLAIEPTKLSKETCY